MRPAPNARSLRVLRALDRVAISHAPKDRIANDPVSLVHPFEDPLDREIVALLASSLAFGNVTTIRAKIKDALARIGPHPAKFVADEAKLHAVMRGFIHRLFRGEDVACLLYGAGVMQREHGSLGAMFERDFAATSDLRESLGLFHDRIRRAGKFPSESLRRGPSHLLPNPRAGSGVKRLLLFLRWMVRVEPGVDFGQWKIPTSALLIPVDVHVHRLGYNLGLTNRKTADFRTSQEITAALRVFDADDPVRYDFPLCHLGISRRCPSRRDPTRCEGCGIKDACRHWEKADEAATASNTASRTRKRSSTGR